MTDIVIAGAGWAGEVQVAAMARARSGRVTHVLSRDVEHAEAAAAPVKATAASIERFPKGNGAVIVATPATAHRDVVERATAEGRAVLVEKPLAPSLADADAIIAAVESSGVQSGYAAHLLFSPAMDRAMGHRSSEPARHLSVRMAQPAPSWGHYADGITSGGVLMELGPEALSVALALAADTPVAVSALIDGGADGVDVDATLRVRFESGCTAVVELSWQSDAAFWDAQLSTDSSVIRLELLPTIVLELDGDDTTPEPTDPLTDFGFVAQAEGFASVCAGRGGRVAPLGFGRLIVEVITAAYVSAGAQGTEVALPFTGDRTRLAVDHWRQPTA